jgi:clan AA aspartic protease (TIGR02281 family)
MIPGRLRWAVGFSVLLAASAAVAAASDSPEDALKARGLKRVGSTYVLAAEGEVQKKAVELKALRNQLVLAARRQAYAEMEGQDQKGLMREMLQQRVALNQEIAALEQQLRNMGTPAPGNLYGIAQRNELVARRNEAVNAYNGLADQIKLIQSGPGGDPAVGDRLRSEVSRRREGFIQAVLDLRQLVDAAAKSYAELADAAAVKGALEALGPSSKTKPKLGPSAQFAANVKLLEQVEHSVISDAVDLRKQGGVFWVNATFNGKVIQPMVFDTGASLTTIPARLAEEIGLKPSPSDPVVRCETADGTVVEARQVTIPAMRVGRFTVNDVTCAVMPAGKGNIAPLLGQSFHRHFTYKFTPESGHLVMSRVEGVEPQAKPARPTRGTAKAKQRAAKSRGTAGKAAADGGPDGDRAD